MGKQRPEKGHTCCQVTKKTGTFTGHDSTRGSGQRGLKISRVWSGRFGSVGFGSARLGSVGFGWVRLGSVRFGSVRFGSVRFGSVRFGSVRFGSVRLGSVRLGSVRFGWVRFGSVRLKRVENKPRRACTVVNYLILKLSRLYRVFLWESNSAV